MALLHNTILRADGLNRRGQAEAQPLSMGGMVRGTRRNWYRGEHTPDKKSGAVDGTLNPASWMLPQTAGGMASRYNAVMAVATSGSAAAGLNGDGTASFAVSFLPADGQLITSGSGSAAITFNATGNALATLNGVGSAAISFSTTADINALGWASAAASMQVTTTLTSYAIGSMTGSTVDNSVLTVDAIAAGVLAAALTSPIAADIKKVNAVTVTGTGSVGDEWGP